MEAIYAFKRYYFASRSGGVLVGNEIASSLHMLSKANAITLEKPGADSTRLYEVILGARYLHL